MTDIEIIRGSKYSLITRPPIGSTDKDLIGKIICSIRGRDLGGCLNPLNLLSLLKDNDLYDINGFSHEFIEHSDLTAIVPTFRQYKYKATLLSLPFIPGKTLDTYFNEDHTVWLSTEEDWKIHMAALITMYANVKTMNSNNVFHNDIILEHIIFDGEHMKLIDFDQATIYKETFDEIEQDDLFRMGEWKLDKVLNSDINNVIDIIKIYKNAGKKFDYFL